MKKIFVLSLLTILLTIPVKADNEHDLWDIDIVPHAGVTYSHFNHITNSWKLGVGGGVSCQVYFGPKIAVDVDISYAHFGAKEAYHEISGQELGPYDYRLDYINTDILARWYPVKFLDVYTGLSLGSLINAKSEYDGQSTDIEDELHDQTLSFPVGASVELGKIRLDARYYFPVTSLPESDKAKDILKKNTRTIGFLFTVGYRISFF